MIVLVNLRLRKHFSLNLSGNIPTQTCIKSIHSDHPSINRATKDSNSKTNASIRIHNAKQNSPILSYLHLSLFIFPHFLQIFSFKFILDCKVRNNNNCVERLDADSVYFCFFCDILHYFLPYQIDILSQELYFADILQHTTANQIREEHVDIEPRIKSPTWPLIKEYAQYISLHHLLYHYRIVAKTYRAK